MLNVAIILGSTRPGRNGEVVAKWVYYIARRGTDATFELIDVKDFNLPLLDEPLPPVLGQYKQPHTKVWAAKIAEFDAFIFVTPEIQPRDPCCAEECHRLSVPRVEPQGRRIRVLRGAGERSTGGRTTSAGDGGVARGDRPVPSTAVAVLRL
jgi:NADPH-dependent FMN reductase